MAVGQGTFSQEEVAFSNWINSNLSDDVDLKRHLPVNSGGDLYTKIQDGLIIWWVCYAGSMSLAS